MVYLLFKINIYMKINKKAFISIIIVSSVITLLTIIIAPHEINYSNNYNNSYNTNTLNTSFLKISNTSLSSNSSYSVCTGTITISSNSPYKYHYIKVKASFLNNSDTVIDTDWTYAIGSEWLDPGESSKFRLSVEKDYNISKCVVTIMED